jgi:hypothetical protein
VSGFDWTPTRNALVTALGTATGPDVAIGNAILADLNRIGDLYDAVFTLEVDADKTAAITSFNTAMSTWTTTATAAWTDAERTVLFVEDALGSAGAAVAFDADSTEPLFTRIDALLEGEDASDLHRELLVAYRAAVAATRSKPTLRIWGGGRPPLTKTTFKQLRGAGFAHVRALEENLSGQVDRAQNYLDALSYP